MSVGVSSLWVRSIILPLFAASINRVFAWRVAEVP